ncbi:hypothetical protein AB6A40_010515 [Gnathostoma spinigerum]|uniref:Bestrophin homolog n=1 Tax=Gnathostoma spinigerum TaxID=75299 RepID=A0ABD6EWS8_9BILA
MGYIESQALLLGNYVRGDDEKARMMRRAMVRWLCLAQVLVFRDISVRVRKRFPTLDCVVKAGYMLEKEKTKYEQIALNYDKYWVPINWTFTLVFEARRAGMITSDVQTNKLCDAIKTFQTNLQTLCNYDWVPLPLVYPQTIFFAVYVFFLLALVSRQYIVTERETDSKSRIDMYVPWMTMIQFVFYVGWAKCTAAMLNPMGEDDDDFECNFLLDKNLATCLSIVDDTHDDVPPIKPDRFWLSKEVEAFYPSTAPGDHPLVGSAVGVTFPHSDKDIRMVVRPSISHLRTEDTLFQRASRRASALLKRHSAMAGLVGTRSKSIDHAQLVERLAAIQERQECTPNPAECVLMRKISLHPDFAPNITETLRNFESSPELHAHYVGRSTEGNTVSRIDIGDCSPAQPSYQPEILDFSQSMGNPESGKFRKLLHRDNRRVRIKRSEPTLRFARSLPLGLSTTTETGNRPSQNESPPKIRRRPSMYARF